jgi:hypothetical protein
LTPAIDANVKIQEEKSSEERSFTSESAMSIGERYRRLSGRKDVEEEFFHMTLVA